MTKRSIKTIRLEICAWDADDDFCVYLTDPESGAGYRIAGQEPFGPISTRVSWDVSIADLIYAVRRLENET